MVTVHTRQAVFGAVALTTCPLYVGQLFGYLLHIQAWSRWHLNYKYCALMIISAQFVHKIVFDTN